MSSKDNDFFGIEYIQNQPQKEEENVKISQETKETAQIKSGSEFLDSAFFPELVDKRKHYDEEPSKEKQLMDKDDIFSDYFVTKR